MILIFPCEMKYSSLFFKVNNYDAKNEKFKEKDAEYPRNKKQRKFSRVA